MIGTDTDQLQSSRGRGRFHDSLNVRPSSSARNRTGRTTAEKSGLSISSAM
jgi:hypothetical protein